MGNNIDNAPSYWLPIVKAEMQGDGRLKVVGLASDGSVDAEGEVIKADANPNSLDWINSGKAVFDLHHHSDHGGPIVGRPEHGHILTQSAARAKYPGVNVVGNAVEVTGYVHGLGSRPEIAPEDLKLIHHYADVGEQLGMSIRAPEQGSHYETINGRRVKVRIPGPIYKIAITPQPVNPNTPCMVTKALGAAMAGDDVEVEEGEWSADTPRLVVTGGVVKALESSPVIPTDGTNGGTALKTQDLGKRVAKADLTDDDDDRTCAGCGATVAKGRKRCDECGEICKGFADYLADLGSILGIRKGASKPPMHDALVAAGAKHVRSVAGKGATVHHYTAPVPQDDAFENAMTGTPGIKYHSAMYADNHYADHQFDDANGKTHVVSIRRPKAGSITKAPPLVLKHTNYTPEIHQKVGEWLHSPEAAQHWDKMAEHPNTNTHDSLEKLQRFYKQMPMHEFSRHLANSYNHGPVAAKRFGLKTVDSGVTKAQLSLLAHAPIGGKRSAPGGKADSDTTTGNMFAAPMPDHPAHKDHALHNVHQMLTEKEGAKYLHSSHNNQMHHYAMPDKSHMDDYLSLQLANHGPRAIRETTVNRRSGDQTHVWKPMADGALHGVTLHAPNSKGIAKAFAVEAATANPAHEALIAAGAEHIASLRKPGSSHNVHHYDLRSTYPAHLATQAHKAVKTAAGDSHVGAFKRDKGNSVQHIIHGPDGVHSVHLHNLENARHVRAAIDDLGL